MSDVLRQARDTLDKLIRMTDLVSELMEVLHVSLLRIRKFEREHDIPLDSETECLLNRAAVLFKEVTSKQKYARLPFIPSDESLQHKKSDEELTEPPRAKYLNWYLADTQTCVLL